MGSIARSQRSPAHTALAGHADARAESGFGPETIAQSAVRSPGDAPGGWSNRPHLTKPPRAPGQVVPPAASDLIRSSRLRANVEAMAADGDKVTVALDAEIVARTRDQLGAGEATDAAVIERALNAYLLGRLMDSTQARSRLDADKAERLASDELHASRRERRGAA
jgi:hypothetical protein